VTLANAVLGIAAIPFVYYGIALFSAGRYFRRPEEPEDPSFTPPVSILKPIRGMDPGAYENLASFCRQDYPNFEFILCVDADDTAVRGVIEQLQHDFPERDIRILLGSGRVATNDKVAKLARLVEEARHEVLAISDSDVRVGPDYLRTVTSALRNPRVGVVTCFYVHHDERNFADYLQTAGMMSDFYAGVLVDWQLEGLKFTLGPSITTTRARLEGFGGYPALENRPADDLLVGRLIAEQGFEVKLLRYTVSTVSDYQSMGDLLRKRLRWIVVMRHMRPWGHIGLVFTQGLPWSLVAIAVHPSVAIAAGYLGAYLALRVAIGYMIGSRGLHQPRLWRSMLLIPVWDTVAFLIWVLSFSRNSIRWRGADYRIRAGQLVPMPSSRGSK
jgi:ceramide glucosyltransferase